MVITVMAKVRGRNPRASLPALVRAWMAVFSYRESRKKAYSATDTVSRATTIKMTTRRPRPDRDSSPMACTSTHIIRPTIMTRNQMTVAFFQLSLKECQNCMAM